MTLHRDDELATPIQAYIAGAATRLAKPSAAIQLPAAAEDPARDQGAKQTAESAAQCPRYTSEPFFVRSTLLAR